MNNKIKRFIPQILTLLFVIGVIGFFTLNAQVNMDNRGIDFGFGFLKQESSFDVQFSLIEYSGSHSYARAYLVGLLNTLLVSFISIIFCTILGVIIGVSRLSSNFLIRNSAAWYVEFFRNIPLLLQIFFWYYAALRALPLPEKAAPWFGVTYMNDKPYVVQKIEEFVKASAKNHKRKKYILGDFKTAKAVSGIGSTAEDIYEVVYIEVIDPAVAKKGKTKSSFTITTKNELTVDSIAYSPKDDEQRFRSGYDALPVYTLSLIHI